MNRRLLIAALATATALCGAHAQTSQKLTAGKATEYGLIYSLPTTALDIYIEAELSEETPGEFYNYAKRHLGIDKAITKPRRTATLRNVVIVPRGIATDRNRMLAQFKAGTSAFMHLTPDNLPLAINTDEIYDQAVPSLPQPRPASPSPLDGDGARQAVTADMARSASTSKKAELAAQRVFELRETRSDILSGNADNPPADGAAMQLVLDNLAAQEAALTAMFEGVRTTSTVVKKVTLVPDSTDIDGAVVARLSAVDGIVDADNLAGAPITVDVTVLELGTLQANEKGEPKSFPKGGVAYTVPGRALVQVKYAGRTVASAEVPLAQLGVVFGLNPSLFTDKKEPYKAIFDPTTGAVVTLAPIAED